MKRVCALLLVLLLPVVASGQGLQIPGDGQGRLRADHVRYDAKNKVFSAEGNVRLVLGDVEVRARRLRLELNTQLAYAAGDVAVVQRATALRADEVRYEIRSKVAYASGGVVLVQEESTVRAERMTLKHDGRTQDVFAEGKVTLEQPGTVLTADFLSANLITKRAEAKGAVRLVRAPQNASSQDRLAAALGQEPTEITAPKMILRWDVNKVLAEGGVVITQPGKTARAHRMIYSEMKGRIELDGSVVVEQSSGQWLVKGGVLEAPADEQTRKALETSTVLRCDRLVILLKERDMQATGHVVVEQRGRSATGERALYTDKDRRIVVTGNVHMRDEDGSQLRAEKVVISLVDETFEAMGNVETEFPVRRGK